MLAFVIALLPFARVLQFGDYEFFTESSVAERLTENSRRRRRKPQRRLISSARLEVSLGRLILLHVFPQAQRAHVGPDFADISQAIHLFADFPGISPSLRNLERRQPERLLLLFVDDNPVLTIILFIA